MDALHQALDRAVAAVAAGLDRWIPERSDDPAAEIHRAMRYAIEGGGKRLRPALLIEATAAAGGERVTALDAAFAVECLHTYSLVHDDLPAMDDDDLRRGRPSLHRAFDEGTAILAGDALLTLAFEILASSDAGADACVVLARAAGAQGMVGGQAGDLAATGADPDLVTVRWIHHRKTGALFGASAEIGGICASADRAPRDALRNFGLALGLAFQIVDDVLDATSDAGRLGKTPGKDARAGKGTYVARLGLEGASAEARDLLDTALSRLEASSLRTPELETIARLVLDRTH